MSLGSRAGMGGMEAGQTISYEVEDSCTTDSYGRAARRRWGL